MFIAVAIGAFGAHMLKERLTTYGLDIFKTASLYHFIHAFGLFIVAWIRSKDETSKQPLSNKSQHMSTPESERKLDFPLTSIHEKV